MQIIVTHDMTDFDGLASAVAAQKLHPEARIVLGRRVGPEVRRYLALHKDRFRTFRAAELVPDTVTGLVIVDVRRQSRLGEYAAIVERAARAGSTLEIAVYDHHPAAEDDLRGAIEVVERVGSTTTLLVERIRERELALDTVEATLFALGIHADTGSLTYAGTTARDAAALAWLLDAGANLAVIARYLSPAMTAEQRALLADLLERMEIRRFGHLDLGFVVHELPRMVDGASEVVSELGELTGHPAVFVVLGVAGKRVQVIARSRSPLVDAGRVVGAVGGGGHPAAAAATLKHAETEAVRADLEAALAAEPPLAARVLDVMTSPVRTVAPELPLRRAAESLAAWRHTGVPVVRADQLVGILSHRDLERAARDGRLDLPVASCMTQHVHTAEPELGLEQALARMQAEDVGRLPVLRQGRVIGIVTRSDLMRILYGPTGSSLDLSGLGGADHDRQGRPKPTQ